MPANDSRKTTAPPVYRPVNTIPRVVQAKVHSRAPAPYKPAPPVIRPATTRNPLTAIQRMPLRRSAAGVIQMTPATATERRMIEQFIDANAVRIPRHLTAAGLKEYFIEHVDAVGFDEAWLALNGILGPPAPVVATPLVVPPTTVPPTTVPRPTRAPAQVTSGAS